MVKILFAYAAICLLKMGFTLAMERITISYPCATGNLVICAKCGLIFIQESVDNKDYTYTVVGLGEYKPLEDVTKKVTTKHLEILVEVEIPSAFLNRT